MLVEVSVPPQMKLEDRLGRVSITCTEVSAMSDKSERPDRSEKQTRRHFSPAEKVAAVKRHLVEGESVADLCDELDITPTLFYGWQKLLFEKAHLTFENGRKARAVEDAKESKIDRLEAKLQKKNEVLAELMEEHTALKKSLGEI
jgi:transposase-like protein